MAELDKYLRLWRFRIIERYFYNTTMDDPNHRSSMSKMLAAAKFWAQPFVNRVRLLCGALFVVA